MEYRVGTYKPIVGDGGFGVIARDRTEARSIAQAYIDRMDSGARIEAIGEQQPHMAAQYVINA